jgi:hypothetical protein
MENQLKKRIRSHASKDVDINKALLLCISSNICFLCKDKTLIDHNNKLTHEAIVDHYHRDINGKGTIRGLICKSCNVKEGKIRQLVEKREISYNKLINRYGKEYIENINILYKNGGILPMEIDNLKEDKEIFKRIYKRRKIDKMDVD